MHAAWDAAVDACRLHARHGSRIGMPHASRTRLRLGAAGPHRSDLHARVDGRAHRPTQRVPAHVVVPVKKLSPPFFPQVLGGPEIEPGRTGASPSCLLATPPAGDRSRSTLCSTNCKCWTKRASVRPGTDRARHVRCIGRGEERGDNRRPGGAATRGRTRG